MATTPDNTAPAPSLLSRLGQTLADRFEISHGGNATIRPMEGLRGIAVSLVFLVHYSTLIEPWITGIAVPVSKVVHGFGHLGVDLFFVLSGFLIYGTIIDRDRFDVAGYTRRRVKRIYPTFLCVLALYLVLSVVFPNESKFPDGVVPALTYLVQNLLLLPGIFDIEPIITVAWSLSYEAFYYIVIPIVIIGLGMRRWPRPRRLAFWSVVLVVGLVALPYFGGPVRLMMFIAGIIVYDLFRGGYFKPHRGGTLALVIGLAIFGLGGVQPIHYPTAFGAVAVLFGLLCLVAFDARSRTGRWLSWTPLRWLGNMSYSYYLIHGLTLKFCFPVLGFQKGFD